MCFLATEARIHISSVLFLQKARSLSDTETFHVLGACVGLAPPKLMLKCRYDGSLVLNRVDWGPEAPESQKGTSHRRDWWQCIDRSKTVS